MRLVSAILAAILILVVALVSWKIAYPNPEDPKAVQREDATPRFDITSVPASALVPAETPPLHPQNLLYAVRRDQMTDADRLELKTCLEGRFKTALKSWFDAYEGRIPFKPEEVTMENFSGRIGRSKSFYLYTFVIGDFTLSIQDSARVQVAYLMGRHAMRELNSMPGLGFQPDLTVPIRSEDVIRMVKADTGVEYKLNEVLIDPTAAACALNGGAFVRVIPTGANPENSLNDRVSMVFQSDGKMVQYTRDQFF